MLGKRFRAACLAALLVGAIAFVTALALALIRRQFTGALGREHTERVQMRIGVGELHPPHVVGDVQQHRVVHDAAVAIRDEDVLALPHLARGEVPAREEVRERERVRPRDLDAPLDGDVPHRHIAKERPVFGHRVVVEQQAGTLHVRHAAERGAEAVIETAPARAGVLVELGGQAVRRERRCQTGGRVRRLHEVRRPRQVDGPCGQTIIDHTPAGRFGQADELISTLIWLCSPGASFVHGVALPVDGGYTAR